LMLDMSKSDLIDRLQDLEEKLRQEQAQSGVRSEADNPPSS